MEKHEWKYYSLGGVTRVSINSGEDIANLANLDQKLWTVLSCPIKDLDFCSDTLKLLDSDNDGIIRTGEIIAASKWLTSRIKDCDLILKGDSTLALDQIADEGLLKSAQHILRSLNAENQNEITLAQASDTKVIFANTAINGDGIITSFSTDSPELKATITDMLSVRPGKEDRSGEMGVDEEDVKQFYADCAAYSQWKANQIYPYAENTQAVLDTVNALNDKVEDFFTRCKLLRFDEQTAQTVAISIDNIADINLCPIAKPNTQICLDLQAINPIYQGLVSKLQNLLQLGNSICEKEWRKIKSSLKPYTDWLESKAGVSVEALGIDRINEILSQNNQESLLSLIAMDKSFEKDSNSIDDVKHLMLLYRDFYKFLNNYVSFTDFYDRDKGAIFEEGKLYIDQRCCNLCIKVNDMSKHGDMAKLSGMFLIYCTCKSVKKAKTMGIVAVMTDGNTSQLRPGKNGLFYDKNGDDWDAVITKIVDNPISISAAFWAPYLKFWNFCVGLITKSAEEKDNKIAADLQAKATAITTSPTDKTAQSKETKLPFDIAKFAGIFAAIGLAIGSIGSMLSDIIKGVSAHPENLIFGLLAVILVISGPSCFIAWSKLRKRNLGPVLNANDWAINSKIIVNTLFGSKLTTLAKYPKAITLNDPYLKKKTAWRWIIPAIIVLIAVFVALVCTDVIQIQPSL